MKKSLSWMFIVTIGLCACTSIEPEVKKMDPFHHVVVNGRRTKMNMALVQTSNVYQVAVVSRHKDSLDCSVRGDTLYISVPKDVQYKYEIQVCAPEIRSINACLLKKLYTPDTLRQDTLMVETGIVDELRLKVHVAQLRTIHRVNKKAYFSGSADVAYLGNKFADVNMDASKLKTKDLYMKLGMGKAYVTVSDHLWIQETFNSQIIFYGDPEIMECKLKWSSIKNTLNYL